MLEYMEPHSGVTEENYDQWYVRLNKHSISNKPVGVYWLLGSRILVLSWANPIPQLAIKWYPKPSNTFSGVPK